MTQPLSVEPVGLPPEGGPHSLDRPQDLLCVGARERRLPRWLGRGGGHEDGEDDVDEAGVVKVTSVAVTTEPAASGVRVNDQ